MQIIVADDDKDVLTLWQKWSRLTDYALIAVPNGKEAVEKAREANPSVCILDVKMPVMDGIEALQKIKTFSPDTQVIMVTAHADVQSAVTAMKEGAYDYLVKPVSFQDVEYVIERAVERRRLLEENRYLRLELGKEATYSELVGQAPGMVELREKIEQAASTSASVLIRSESGTGKELVARLIHYGSKRSRGPFITVNIAAFSESLIESEMFGHEKGAFTGAAEEKKGRFELADKGTLLLDEVSEIPLHQQVKFLRVIQEREVEKVGGTSPIKVDTRIISTTNRDLERLVKDGKFREDLYYRLNVFSINIPPLRERKDDIPQLANHYLKIYARKEDKLISSISREAMTKLVEFDWPGNVRELINCIESSVVMEKGKELSIESIMASKNTKSSEPPVQEKSCCTLKEIERDHIQRVLDSTGRDKKKAAASLGISRTTLYQKIKEFGT